MVVFEGKHKVLKHTYKGLGKISCDSLLLTMQCLEKQI